MTQQTTRAPIPRCVPRLLFLLIALQAAFLPSAGQAQTLPFLGRVNPDRTPISAPRLGLAAGEEASPWLFFGNPLLSGSSSSWSGELDLGVSYTPPNDKGGLPFTLLGFGGKGRSVGDGTAFHYAGGYGDLTFFHRSIVSAKAIATYSDSSSTRTLGGGVMMSVKPSDNFGFGATALRSSSKSTGETVSDWKYEASITRSWSFFSEQGQLSLTPRYTFKNDIDGEDFYEVDLRLDLPTGSKNRSSAVTLSAGKHSTIIVGWELDLPGH